MHYITTQKCFRCKAQGTGTLLKNKVKSRFTCKVCDTTLYEEIANEQKANWLRTGSVWEGK